jgi:predicted small metal-binding protein
MKTITCRQLGGACDTAFRATSFEEVQQLSKQHGMEMFQKGDKAHLEAMNAMMELMKTPDAMKTWLETKRAEFNALPENG